MPSGTQKISPLQRIPLGLKASVSHRKRLNFDAGPLNHDMSAHTHQLQRAAAEVCDDHGWKAYVWLPHKTRERKQKFGSSGGKPSENVRDIVPSTPSMYLLRRSPYIFARTFSPVCHAYRNRPGAFATYNRFHWEITSFRLILVVYILFCK